MTRHVVVGVMMVLAVIPASAFAQTGSVVPRGPDGKPDLTGIWRGAGGRNELRDESKIQQWAKDLMAERARNFYKDGPQFQCMPSGPAQIAGGMRQIVQGRGVIAVLNADLTYRQIFTDGRKLEDDPLPIWTGYSVGRWDGDTLVVESNGYNDRTWLDHEGHPHTEALRMIERYRRRDFGHLDIDVTITDPKAYAKPWTVSVKAELAPDTEMIEFVCGEKNAASLEHWIGKASDEQNDEAAVSIEILRKYIGTYDEQPKYWRNEPRTVVITMSEGRLFGNLNGQGAVRLVARSTTLFSGLNGLGVEFVPGADGVPSTLFVKHVSGDYKFARRR